MEEILYGRNVAREVLRARRRHIHKVILADNIERSAIIKEIIDLAKSINVSLQTVSRHKLNDIGKEHQGVAVEVGRYPLVTAEDILRRAGKLEEAPFIIALDHITDPHNVGAILRTAEIVGVHGVLLPKQRAAGITPAVVKASAGAAEHMWVAQVPNLVQAMKNLKQENVWVGGIEDAAEATPYHQANLSGPILLVVGSEGQGMSRLVRETCDFIVNLPMRGQIESLNASVAAALVLYEVWRTRAFTQKFQN
jgi:23S rRNA (guanosine2251-2'-O)-methyltransferase